MVIRFSMRNTRSYFGFDFKFTLTFTFADEEEPMSESTALPGLRVAVTGGTSGLGLALVQDLRRTGAEVAFLARHGDRVREVARDNPGTHGIVGDVARKTETHV